MKPALRQFLSELGLGRLAYLAWHRPRAALARSRREGGPLEQWIDARGRRAMQAAAAALPPQPAVRAGAPEVAFLTGRKYWYQTALCCWTLRRHAPADLRPVFFDDGTFDAALRAEALRVFPGALLQGRTEVEARLDATLPARLFPTLRAHREPYVHLRKLTDIHAGMTGWRVVLDSDMLFFREPTALLQWLASPAVPLHMTDVQNSYGYDGGVLTRLAGRALPPRLNVGICGLRSDALDWNQLEAWCAELLSAHGSSYYLEQALVALWLSRGATQPLAAPDYRVMPTEDECRAPTAVMHHYVDQSKRGYFRHAWRRALQAG